MFPKYIVAHALSCRLLPTERILQGCSVANSSGASTSKTNPPVRRELGGPGVTDQHHLVEHTETGPLLDASTRSLLPAAIKAYRARRERDRIFGPLLFADPIWDLLLDLFIAACENRTVSVSSACIAASVPSTTALRYIRHMVATELVVRTPNPGDHRSTFLELTPTAISKMATYLSRTSTAPGDCGA